MLQIQTLRDEKDRVIRGLKKKGLAEAARQVDDVILLDEERKDLQHRLNKLQEDANRQSAEIGSLMKSGNKEAAESLKSGVASIKEQIKNLESSLQESETKLFEALVVLPNVAHESVPEGKTPEENEVVGRGSVEPGDMPEWALPHWELISRYDIIDFENGNKVSGAGFPFYK